MIACASPKNLFINCTRDALVNMSVTLLPSRSVILEILGDSYSRSGTCESMQEVKASRISPGPGRLHTRAEQTRTYRYSRFIKVDFRSSDAETRKEIYRLCRNTNTAFVAEKVETLEEVQAAQAEGNTLFQGYFHSRPEVIAETQISTNKFAYLQMFAVLATPSPDIKKSNAFF